MASLFFMTACGRVASTSLDAGSEGGTAPQAATASESPATCPDLQDRLPYASEVVSFLPGEGAGFGGDKLPNAVLGPPKGAGTHAGSMDVVSLGVGGEIILGFGDLTLTDGPGPDFIVFENPFWPGGDSSRVWAELAEVSVSADGETWMTFPCDTKGDGFGHWPGCAGWRPVQEYDPCAAIPLGPDESGGDPFDLAQVGLAGARFVRVRDLATEGESPSAGFDLDAVGTIHLDLP